MPAYPGKYAIFALPLLITATPGHPEGVKFDAVVSDKESIRLDFADPSKHLFRLVRREGKTEGQGPLSGVISRTEPKDTEVHLALNGDISNQLLFGCCSRSEQQ